MMSVESPLNTAAFVNIYIYFFFIRIEQGRWLTTSNANKMTPQLQTSAFLPSYFSPCAAMTQRLKNVLTSKWIYYSRRTRVGRMGNHTFWFRHLLPKVAFPTRRPRRSPLVDFYFFMNSSLHLSRFYENRVRRRKQHEWLRTGNFLVLILKQRQRCTKGIENLLSSFLALQGACHQSHYLWTHSMGLTVSFVCMFGFTLVICFKRAICSSCKTPLAFSSQVPNLRRTQIC